MNRLALSLAALLAAAPLGAIEPAFPSGSQGAVTLDWKKFDEMWTRLQEMQKKVEKLEHPENRPPVAFALSQAVYRGEIQRKKAEVSAIFELDVFERHGWVKVPFLPATAAIQDVKLDGAAVGVIEEDGNHVLVVRGAGRHTVAVRFALKAPDLTQAPQLHINVVSTPMTLVSMRFPQKNLDVTVEPSQGTELRPAEGGTLVTAAVPPTSDIGLRWQKAVPEEESGPAKLYVETEGLMTLSEGSARAHFQLNYNVLHRGVREIQVVIPSGWNVLSAACEGLQEWKTKDGPQGQVLVVQLAYAKKNALTVAVDVERGIGEKEEVVELPRLRPLDVEREQGTLGVEAKGSLEIQVAESSGLNPIDPQELPGSLWQTATQPILYAFRYTKPHQLSVSIKRHPEVAVLTTTIDDANAVTLMTERGQEVTRIRYQVRNHLRQYLTLRLPEGAQLWSAFVADEPVKPTEVEKNVYRIPLAKSQIEGSGQSGFPVELVYYIAARKFSPLGYRAAQFPVPDAPASRLFWSLYVPEKYRFVHFGGDMEKGALAMPWQSLLGRAVVNRDELLDVESIPESKSKKAAVLRQDSLKKDLAALAYGLGGVNSPAPVDAQMAMESEVAAAKPQQLKAGVFPIAFEVPASGQLFHFGQVMVVDQAPRVTMVYLHAWFFSALKLILLAFLGWGLYRRRQALLAAGLQLAQRIRLLALRHTVTA